MTSRRRICEFPLLVYVVLLLSQGKTRPFLAVFLQDTHKCEVKINWHERCLLLHDTVHYKLANFTQ